MDFNMKEILEVLKNSKHIEEVLIETYHPITSYVIGKKINRQLPLMNAALYKSIHLHRKLPSPQQYYDYIRENYSDFQDSEKVAEKSIIYASYIGLVNELHFYFLLKESGKFDEVTFDYTLDLYMKTDILVRKGSRTLGVQLFLGTEESIAKKEIDINKISNSLSYELILFPLRRNIEKRKQIDLKLIDEKLYLYSEKDVEEIFLHLKNQSERDYTTELINILEDEKSQFQEHVLLPENAQGQPKETGVRSVHSVLYITDDKKMTKSTLRDVLLDNGISAVHTYLFKLKKQKKSFEPIHIIDGDFSEYPGLLDKLREITSLEHFNQEQYEVEHAPEEDMMIIAGAGSGKTHTLIQRTLYLLSLKKVRDLSEIVMITFTNEAADNLKYELEERLTELFKETGQKEYLEHIQAISRMKVMTIPAFAKYILQELGHHLGFGNRVGISALTLERRRVIVEMIQETYERNPTYTEKMLEGLRPFEIVAFLESIWDELNKKGVLGEELAKHKFLDSKVAQFLNDLIVGAEKRLDQLKVEGDMVTLSDLTKNLVKLSKSNIPLDRLRNQFKYLFVDEFQDSDNSQIQFIATLAVKANINLLVVGDVKQSIYRFRGANSTAFTKLNMELNQLDSNRLAKVYELYYNYRTSGNVLDNLEGIFESWKESNYLPKDRRMEAFHSEVVGELNCLETRYEPGLVKSLFEQLPVREQGKSPVLSILVRSNREVEQIGKSLQSFKLPIIVTREGTLYISKAATDLLNLLYSWIYSERSWALYSLAQTYFYPLKEPRLEVITKSDDFLETNPVTLMRPRDWLEAVNQLQYTPFYIILNDYLGSVEQIQRLSIHIDDDIRRIQYELNLQKIMNQLFTEVDIDTVDLMQVYQWLKIKVDTVRDVDEATIEQEDYNKSHIRVMTVHQSKGLQFDTVLLPNTGESIIRNVNEDKENIEDIVVHVDRDILEYGWYKKVSNQFKDVVSNYEDLKKVEHYEALQEEARILYVALTRVERSLYVCKPNQSSKSITWESLIKGGGTEHEDNYI